MPEFLYSQAVVDFVRDASWIEKTLRRNFESEHLVPPSESEVLSWKRSLPPLAAILDTSDFAKHQVLCEVVPPAPGSRRRADVILLGRNREGQDVALVIENKWWPDNGIHACPIADFLVVGTDEKLHPSIQAENYARQLRSYHEAVTATGAVVCSCCFFPGTKQRKHSALNAEKFRSAVEIAPIFVSGEVDRFRTYLTELMPFGPTAKFVKDFQQCRYSPSKSLLLMARDIFNDDERWSLDERQQLAFNTILAAVRDGDPGQKHVIVVKGGPGTGKSLIGVKLLGRFAAELGSRVVYAAGNSSFRDNLAGSLARAVRDRDIEPALEFESLFTNFRVCHGKDRNAYDLVICDEAQRLQPDSSTQYEKVTVKQEQCFEVINASRVSVFFLDEFQRVRHKDVGSVERIQQTADYHDATFNEFDLVSQFRCCQSENYIASVNSIFGLEGREEYVAGRKCEFDFRVFDDPACVENELKGHLDNGWTARILAGYCWPWTKTKSKTEPLTPDVVIGEWKRPWNRSSTASGKAYLRTNYLWANDPANFEQVGCIHTSHGIEFDFVGVLMGGDLIYSPKEGWTVVPDRVFDRGFKNGIAENLSRQLELLKNIYRTLMTRAKLGCFVYCGDKATRDFLVEEIQP